MTFEIGKAAVLGSGVMGAAIAAHLANVGIPSLLLDMVPTALSPEEQAKGYTLETPEVRNRIARLGLEAALRAKPAAFYVPESAQLVSIGNLEDDLPKLKDCDWIIEVIVERLDIKRSLLARVVPHLNANTIVSSNTSGISIHAMAETLPADIRRRFLGTHFFNPPRYMKLLELIPTKDTAPEVVAFMEDFANLILGKGVVRAKDTPNFIANRIGVYGLLETLRAMAIHGLSIEEVDAITGPLIGRPKSATFRTLDVVGLDTFLHVARNVAIAVTDPAEKSLFAIPPYLELMAEKGWLGQKSGQGFYKTMKTAEGKQHWAVDLSTVEHRPPRKPSFDVEAVKAAGGLKQRIQALVTSPGKAGLFGWEVIKKTLLYTAGHAQELADDIVAIDRAMRWGFNWEQGPFEIWDALGVVKTVERMKAEGDAVPAWIEAMLDQGCTSFYKQEKGQDSFYGWQEQGHVPAVIPPGLILLKAVKERTPVILHNSGASLVDIGDGVTCFEFHSPNNSIGGDILTIVHQAVAEVEKNWNGMVLANQGRNFCVGANLMLILMEAQDEEWDEIDEMVRAFQGACMALKYCRKPIVSAPHAMCLGGGAEFVLHTSQVRPAAETYMGLVEVGVGLIPGGGGHKEMLFRAMEGLPDGVNVDLQPFVNKVFETIAMAKVSTSAVEAKKLGYLRKSDDFTSNGDRHIYTAKQAVLAMNMSGYTPPRPHHWRVVGETGCAVMKLGAYTLRKGGYISEYDEHLAGKVAHVLSGGKVPANSMVTEQWLLDIEREAFLSLVGEPKTQARMQHMLAKGKPLRN